MHRDQVQHTGHAVDILSGNSHCAIQAVAAKASEIRFWGVQYHPELHFSDIARCLERSDFVDIFEAPSAIGLNAPAGLSREEIIHDFHHLDEDKNRAALKERYNLSQTVFKRSVHECELSNWLDSF